MDVGGMFLNYWLHPSMQLFAGVDIAHVRHEGKCAADREKDRNSLWERWCRNFMGLTDSPYHSLPMLIRAKQMTYGDRLDENNPFQWSKVVLNLPGSKEYDPTWPWGYKVGLDGHLASEVYVYIDDGRLTGHSKLECWRAARRFCSTVN